MFALNVIALILLIVGGLNWGLVGLANFNLVDAIFGGVPMIARLIYILVGLAAVYGIVFFSMYMKHPYLCDEEQHRHIGHTPHMT